MDEREAAEREEIGGGETNGDWLGFHPGHWFYFAAGMGKRSETPTSLFRPLSCGAVGH